MMSEGNKHIDSDGLMVLCYSFNNGCHWYSYIAFALYTAIYTSCGARAFFQIKETPSLPFLLK